MDIEDIREMVLKYSDMLYRICFVILCNEQDVQDAVQDTFCRYLEKKPDFHDEEHKKAWLIKVATNISRDKIRFRIWHATPAFSVQDDAIVKIINEEAPAYYSGQKGIDDVVSIIQNRIQLYVDENG